MPYSSFIGVLNLSSYFKTTCYLVTFKVPLHSSIDCDLPQVTVNSPNTGEKFRACSCSHILLI